MTAWKRFNSRHGARGRRHGFTLAEIMIVVSIIGMLVAMCVPAFVKARKQAQGRRTINDARQMDGAIDEWAMEVFASDGQAVNSTGAATYLKARGWKTNDVLGNAFIFGNVGTQQVQISSTTKISLANVGIDWGPY